MTITLPNRASAKNAELARKYQLDGDTHYRKFLDLKLAATAHDQMAREYHLNGTSDGRLKGLEMNSKAIELRVEAEVERSIATAAYRLAEFYARDLQPPAFAPGSRTK